MELQFTSKEIEPKLLLPGNSLKVVEFYKDKTVLLTGCTGFLGKIILEKFLRSCPDVKKIFVMVRPKRNVNPMDRIKKEILESECFNEVREIYGGH